MYNNGLCSLCYTTNLLKDGCLASIGSSYDKNAKMGTSVLLPEQCDILHLCNCKEPVNFFHFLEEREYFDPPDAVTPAISAITNVFTSKKGWFV
jgi:hypothetical protein